MDIVWNLQSHDQADLPNYFYTFQPINIVNTNGIIAPNGSYLDSVYQEYALEIYPNLTREPISLLDVHDFNANPLGGSAPAIANLVSSGGNPVAFALSEDQANEFKNKLFWDALNPLISSDNPLSAAYAQKANQIQLEKDRQAFNPNSLIKALNKKETAKEELNEIKDVWKPT